jgi:hypothetical protein
MLLEINKNKSTRGSTGNSHILGLWFMIILFKKL